MPVNDRLASAIAVAGIAACYAVFGLVVLVPEGLYSGDIGVKFVQARALADSGFTSLDLPYPGAFLDPAREFFPLRPPFVMKVADETQAIFSPAVAVLQGGLASAAGLRGLTLLSVCAAFAVLLAVRHLAPAGLKTAAVVSVGLASPLWSYAVLGWEHAPAVAFSTIAFAIAAWSTNRWSSVFAGAFLGAGALLRDEVLLVLPGLLLISLWRTRSPGSPVLAALGAFGVLACGGTIDALHFGRPVAAHLLHAVDVAGSDIDDAVPALEQLTTRGRYEAVIQYWLLGYGNDFWIVVFAATFVVAWAVRWRWPTTLGTVPLWLWLSGVVILGAMDAWEFARAPKWLAGLHRVSPYLVCALLPAPFLGKKDRQITLPIVVTSVLFVAVAFAMTKTTGGKSLGPRLLLPLLPLLAVAALVRIAEYLKSDARIERLMGIAGVALVVIGAIIHVAGTVPAYYVRNRDDSSAVLTALRSPARVVVADDMFTAQLLFPLYYRKIILLADTYELRARLGTRLADEKVPEALLISRRPEPGMRLSPLKIRQSDSVGRFIIQYWGRVGRDLN